MTRCAAAEEEDGREIADLKLREALLRQSAENETVPFSAFEEKRGVEGPEAEGRLNSTMTSSNTLLDFG